MTDKTLLSVVVNCNTLAEARSIGRAALRARLAGCYDVTPRAASEYFWPPRSGKIERGKGYTLFLQTTPRFYPKLEKLAKRFHSDAVPMIAAYKPLRANADYLKWLGAELSGVSTAGARPRSGRRRKQ